MHQAELDSQDAAQAGKLVMKVAEFADAGVGWRAALEELALGAEVGAVEVVRIGREQVLGH